MHKKSHNLLIGISVLPALLVMPAMGETYVANVNNVQYETLGAAIGDVEKDGTQEGANVTLLTDVAQGAGKSVKSGSEFMVDFGDKTFTAYKTSVGSTGTETQIFQLLRDSTITLKNGTINVASPTYDTGKFKMAIHNYSNLTLDNMIVDGRNLLGNNPYTVSNNFGDTLIKNSKIIAKNGGFALDSCYYSSYTGVSVTVENSELIGRIEVTAGSRAVGDDKHELTITGGTLAAETSGYRKLFNEGTTNLNNVALSDNKAQENGAAIYNKKRILASNAIVGRGIVNLTGTTFANNQTTGIGGAIYNDTNATLTLSGANTFTGNVDNTGANDIYNVGALTVVDGTTTIDGGIAGTGTLTIANGATLNIGSTTLTQGAVELNGTIIAALNDANDFAKFNVGAFSGTGNMNLALKSAGEYKVFDDAVFTNDNVTVESSVYDIVWNDGKDTITATLKSVEDIAKDNDLSTDAAQTVANLAETTSEKLNDLGMRVQEQLASGNADAAQDVNDAINPETTSVVQAMTTSVQNTIANVAAGRMALPTIGRNGGDMNVTARGVWAQGLYNRSKYNDRFSGDTYGVAAGFDTTINHDVTIGAGYAYNNSDIDATLRNTDIDSHTIFVYGQYKPAEWYVNGTLNYTMSKYSESGNVLGTLVDSDYDVNSFGAQVMTGYDFASGITPEFGLRYMHITTDDYTNSLGIKNHMDDNDFLTAVLGTKYTFDIRATRELMLRPELRYAVKCDIVSDKLVSTVAMPGIAAYTLDAERMSRIGNEFGVGLNMLYRGLDMSVSYEIDIREDYTSQTGMLKFRYNF